MQAGIAYMTVTTLLWIEKCSIFTTLSLEATLGEFSLTGSTVFVGLSRTNTLCWVDGPKWRIFTTRRPIREESGVTHGLYIAICSPAITASCRGRSSTDFLCGSALSVLRATKKHRCAPLQVIILQLLKPHKHRLNAHVYVDLSNKSWPFGWLL